MRIPHPTKAPLRDSLRAMRRSFGEDALSRGSAAIALRVLELPELGALRTIALYQSLPGEVRLTPLWEELASRGTRCVFPRVVRGTRRLDFAPVVDPAELVAGVLGIREPSGPGVELQEIDAFLVPGLAFDPGGGRLGQGGGYYDATLAAAPRALRIGACLDEQLLDEVPVEVHDARVDIVITPTRTFRAPR
ncbi:5-formyltetrahydrofolate cyclo-ligase [Vulgatibacter incomptus]|nr:5-formyltetrahydrofolate cyclo-ligase [Vulgatibacter incomptus]